MEYFKKLYCYLPRAGPGDNASTRKAFAAIKDLPNQAQILDIGCGPGVQTVELLSLCDGVVTALDLLPEMIARIKEAVHSAGYADRVNIVQTDMNEMSFELETFDLIWSEGAIYLMGFKNGLAKIKPFLKTGGYVAVSEAVWLKSNPPDEVVKLWEEYPEIDTVDNKLQVIAELGYDLIDHFILPSSSWTDSYYNHLEKLIKEYESQWGANPEAESALEAARNEVSVFKRFSEYYSYVFFIMRK